MNETLPEEFRDYYRVQVERPINIYNASSCGPIDEEMLSRDLRTEMINSAKKFGVPMVLVDFNGADIMALSENICGILEEFKDMLWQQEGKGVLMNLGFGLEIMFTAAGLTQKEGRYGWMVV